MDIVYILYRSVKITEVHRFFYTSYLCCIAAQGKQWVTNPVTLWSAATVAYNKHLTFVSFINSALYRRNKEGTA